MENLAYLYLAYAHEDSHITQLISWNSFFYKAPVPNWKRSCSKACMYMQPLAVTLSILSAVSTVLALEIGNQKSSDLSVNIEVSILEQLE